MICPVTNAEGESSLCICGNSFQIVILLRETMLFHWQGFRRLAARKLTIGTYFAGLRVQLDRRSCIIQDQCRCRTSVLGGGLPDSDLHFAYPAHRPAVRRDGRNGTHIVQSIFGGGGCASGAPFGKDDVFGRIHSKRTGRVVCRGCRPCRSCECARLSGRHLPCTRRNDQRSASFFGISTTPSTCVTCDLPMLSRMAWHRRT